MSTQFTVKINNAFKAFIKDKLLVRSNLRESCVTITIKGNQCFIHLGEFIIFCCTVPSMVKPIIALKHFHDGFLLLLTSNEGCCAINLTNKNIEHWPDGKEMIIDDYLNVGHDHLVVCFPNNDFIVTDFKCCVYDTRISSTTIEDKEKEEVKCSNDSILSSLSHKLVQTKSQTQLLESNIREKEEMIEKCCQSMLNMSLDIAYKDSGTTSLVSLFPESIKPIGKEPMDEKRQFQAKFEILSKWFKKMEQSLIIGCSIKNENEEFTVQNASMSVNIADSDITSCRTIVESTSKQHAWKFGSEKLLLVAVDLPCLGSKSTLKFQVKLHFNLLERPEKLYCCFIGECVLSRLEFLTMECLSRKEYLHRNREDCIAFEFVACKHRFVLESKVTHLETVFNVLSKRMNCSRSTIGNITVLFMQNLNSEIRLQNMNHYCEVTIFSKSRDNLSSLMNEIESILPADVNFQPCTDSSKLDDVCEKLLAEANYYLSATQSKLRKIEAEEKERDVIVLDSPENCKSETVNNMDETMCKLVMSTDISVAQLLQQM